MSDAQLQAMQYSGVLMQTKQQSSVLMQAIALIRHWQPQYNKYRTLMQAMQ